MVSPRFLGPKIFITCSPAGPCFLCGLLLSWMGMLLRLWWWMRTRRDVVCELPGTIGKMGTSKQLLIGQGNMVLLGLCSDIKGVMRGSTSWGTTVYGWLKYFQKKGDYFHTQKRGCKRILAQTECAEVQDAITKLRTEPNAK